MSTQSLTSDLLEFDGAADVIEHYFRSGWTDGLPVVPPTPERVGEFLDYVGRSPSEILGTEPTKGRVITVEKVAINAVMAGCLPEYFPVVLAAVEALVEPQFNLHAITVSTMGAAVLAVVNGPIANDLAMNSSVSVFGPGHQGERYDRTGDPAGDHQCYGRGYGRAGQGDAGTSGQVHLVYRGGARRSARGSRCM